MQARWVSPHDRSMRPSSSTGIGQEKPGKLKVKKNQRGFSVEFTPNKPKKAYRIYGAYLGHGLETKVPRGENANKTLRHEFVVLQLNNERLKQKDNKFVGQLQLPLRSKAKTKSLNAPSLKF